LENYERAKKLFLVSYQEHDEVASQRIERFGEFDKAEDYLVAFAKFIRENETSISALNVLLNKPQQWQPQVLNELYQKLKENDYDKRILQAAHARVYHKDLADIISMVKHAADEQELLLTAKERVNKAMQQVTAGKSFDDEQQKWLDLIQEHLMENLTIDEEDFDYQPIFEQRGGRGKAQKVFGAQFQPLIREFNTAIAA
jgi:type I restriction enzyme R subunit